MAPLQTQSMHSALPTRSTVDASAGRGGPFVSRSSALLLMIGAALLSACAVTPKPISVQEMEAQRQADTRQLATTQTLSPAPLTLHEAMARALLYNLDQRQVAMQEALALRQTDLAGYAMLPKVVLQTSYLGRNPVSGARSQSLTTGQQSLVVSTSEERNRLVSSLQLGWNVLDFGMSYLQAHQQADRALIAAEARRASTNQLLQEVRRLYWEAVATQRVKARMDADLDQVRIALQDSHAIETKQIGNPMLALRYQHGLLDTLTHLQAEQRKVDQAKLQLAQLMGLPPGADFTLEVPAQFAAPALSLPKVENLESAALINRPELRQEAYQQRISAADTRLALLSRLPGLNLLGGWNYDSNQFLYRNNWLNIGAQLSWNLLSLASLPAAKHSGEAAEEVGHARRLALSMAVMMQVRMAVLEYGAVMEDYKAAADLSAVDSRTAAQVEALRASKRASGQEVVAARLNAVLSSVKRDLAYADLQNTAATLYTSLGTDPLPDDTHTNDVGVLAAALKQNEDKWLSARFSAQAQ